MKAGFLNLFSRSLYRSTASRVRELDPDSEEGRMVHDERERFAAAAIAFCLEHDTEFRQHFWQTVCGGIANRRSSAMPTVEVEPRRWADLLLNNGNLLCAVEIKIGARLADHQNPRKGSFWKPHGYGGLLMEHCRERSSNARYMVLGCELDLGLRRKEKIHEVEVGQRSWEDLVTGLPATRLMKDLTSLLSGFGIWQFTFKAMKNKMLSGTLGDVGSAFKILESVRNNLAWPESSKVVADRDDDGGWWGLGIYLSADSKKKLLKGLAERLLRDNKPPKGTGVAWFGYYARAGESAKRCVYLYCSKTIRQHLIERLRSAQFNIDEDTSKQDGEGGPYCVVICAGHDKLGDSEWFKLALEASARAR